MAGPVERAVGLLARLDADPPPASVAELAHAAGMPTSTAYRMLAELERHGLVARDPAGGVRLGVRMLALGRRAEADLRARLVAPAAPVLERLSREHGETAILTAPCGVEALALHVVEADHPVRLSHATFRRAPLHLGASGKVLAAFLEPAERERLIAAVGDRGLSGALAAIRDQGWVTTSDELDAGATAAAAPIRDARGRLLAGLSLAGPTERLRGERLAAAVDGVRAAAAAVERAIR